MLFYFENTGSQKNKGFTLVEILAVLMIIGIMAGVIVLSIPAPVSDIEKNTQKLKRIISQISQSAVINNKAYGFSVSGNKVEFMRYENELWQKFETIEFSTQNISIYKNGVRLNLKNTKHMNAPIIIYYTTGLATDFELQIEDEQKVLRLRGGVDGKLKSEQAK